MTWKTDMSISERRMKQTLFHESHRIMAWKSSLSKSAQKDKVNYLRTYKASKRIGLEPPSGQHSDSQGVTNSWETESNEDALLPTLSLLLPPPVSSRQ